jgi:rod shape-determining protein MreC
MRTRAPDLFSRGPALWARQVFYCALAMACITVDFRFHQLDALRNTVSVLLEPLQEVANIPGYLTQRLSESFESERALREENTALRLQLMQQADLAQQDQFIKQDLESLRTLTEMHPPNSSHHSVAEIIAMSRNPFVQKMIIGRGLAGEIKPGSPVISIAGLVGQVTRVSPLNSEVTLITDKNQALPVMVLRNGLRAIAYGTGENGTLSLPYVPVGADLQVGDVLVTSGLDGIYPPGLSVATLITVVRDPSSAFTHVSCVPNAAVSSTRYVLVLDPSETSAIDIDRLDNTANGARAPRALKKLKGRP